MLTQSSALMAAVVLDNRNDLADIQPEQTGWSVLVHGEVVLDKRDKIIDAAIELFAEQGFEATSIAAICDKIGGSKGLVFHHFKSKNELLREAFKRVTKIVCDSDKRYSKVATPKERVAAYIDSIFAAMSASEYKALYQLNFNVMIQPGTRALLLDLIEERVLFMRKEAEEVFKYAGYANSGVVSQMFIAEIDGIALNYLFDAIGFPLNEVKEEFIRRYT